MSLWLCQWVVAATLLVGLITAGVVWWQGSLIKKQIQFQSFIELDKEWNLRDMVETRETAFNKEKKEYDLYRLEGILEFLEKFASFKKAGVLDMNLIYNSNIGWYASRYYFFNKHNIATLRKQWKDNLYQDLEDLYEEYLALELKNSDKTRESYEKDMESTRKEFIEDEGRN